MRAKAGELEARLKVQPDETEALKKDIDSLLSLNHKLEDSIGK